jgi:Flp pilus assembly protein TadD
VGELKRLLSLHKAYYLIDEAESKFTQGRLEEAILHIQEALKINPGCDDAYLDLGLIYLRAKRLDEAAEALRKAVKINSKIVSVIRQIPKLGLVDVPEDFMKLLGFV